MLAGAKWRTVNWRSGTKGRLKARFAAVRVRIADGPPQRIWNKGQQHLPGEEATIMRVICLGQTMKGISG
jgi:SRSO17 transposase